MKREERQKLREQLKQEVIEKKLTWSQAVRRYDEMFNTHYAKRLLRR